MSLEELEHFVDAFIARERKDRWKTLLASANGRRRLTATFAHGYDFDPRWATHLTKGTNAQEVIARLTAKGGRMAYILSEHSPFDGATIPLAEAVGEFFGMGFGAYLICDPVRLAYFESEDVGGHYLLSR